MAKDVDFIGIGAEKAATQWLAACLKEHPDICYAHVPEGREIFYFNEFDRHYLKYKNKKYYWGEKWYLGHFSHCSKNSIKGEISPTYLYSKKTAERIYKFNPDIKIIVMLRNPVERSISQYNHDISLGVIPDTGFSQALKNNPTIIEKSLYYKYLKYYYELFAKKNILVILLDDVKKDPNRVMRKIYKFLGVTDTNFKPHSLDKKINVTSEQIVPGLNNILLRSEYVITKSDMWWIVRLLGKAGIRKFVIELCYKANLRPVKKKKEVSVKMKRKLNRMFVKDLEKLERLINRELDNWKDKINE